MVTVINDESVSVHVPAGVTDLEAFRRWADAPDFPEQGSIWWLKGEVWADMSKQQLFSHVLVKTEISFVLRGLTRQEPSGLFFSDGAMLSNFPADVAGVPDGLFVSTPTLESDRVRLIEGKKSGFVEVQGAPDMVLEVISDGSVHKDEVMLKVAYFEAGIPEYWLIDARKEPLRFSLFKRGKNGYVATRSRHGWLRSEVLGRSFRLVVATGPAKHVDYHLETS